MSPQLANKIRAVHTLTTRGATEGEREAAKAALDRLLVANKVTLDQVIGAPKAATEPVERFAFYFKTLDEFRVLQRVVSRVMFGHTHMLLGRTKGTKRVVVLMTHSQSTKAYGLYQYHLGVMRAALKITKREVVNRVLSNI